MLSKPIRNSHQEPYLDWIRSGAKQYEGRLATKMDEWGLHVGQYIKFYAESDVGDHVVVKVTSLLIYPDFGSAFDELGEKLIPGGKVEFYLGSNKTPQYNRTEVVDLYNNLFHYPDETLETGVPSKLILDTQVVAIGFELV